MIKILPTLGLVILVNGAVHSSVLAAPSKSSQTKKPGGVKAPALTRANFVSIDMQVWGGFAGIQEQVVINSNIISSMQGRMSGGGGGFNNPNANQTPALTSALSNNQLDALLRLLNQVKLPTMAGNYNQPELRDGFHELLVLRFSNDKNSDRTIVIQNYGDKAPANYYKVTAYLRQLQRMKFEPVNGASTPTPVIEK